MKKFLRNLCSLIILFFIGNVIISIFNNNFVTTMTYYFIGYLACIIFNYELIFGKE